MEIATWADTLRDREVLFHDSAGSNKLGYRDVVLPGPMQSAFIDNALRKQIPEWELSRLSMSFRQSIVAGDPITINLVVIDKTDNTLTLDITVENRATGDRSSTGTATMHRR